ncbi:ABC transporter substrate-binding protein [Sphingomonas sp. J344]|uniref:ABC transporter substrate-binding protein n=1 Tax=Sphingomonas sp. J344 TaxID=2898434 RepID=UPI002150CF72|nr:ABC transporter substrate-binding protein [Sphingomonas sp. J344]MCR5872008.1 ABC transporter substrate-binding protein [Sphingomonas sp. J344]
MRSPALPFAVALALIAGGCERRPDDVAVVVSTIGGAAELSDPAKGELDFSQRVVLSATAQGLVRFDANGGIEPGIAERWIVTDGGRSYIFRLRDAEWDDGEPITAADVVASMRATIGPPRALLDRPFCRRDRRGGRDDTAGGRGPAEKRPHRPAQAVRPA